MKIILKVWIRSVSLSIFTKDSLVTEVHSVHRSLTGRETQTKDQCIFECLSLVIHATCGCVTGYMANYNAHYTPCSLYDHADCVSPLIKHFNHTACSCLPACSEKIPQGQLIQYG